MVLDTVEQKKTSHPRLGEEEREDGEDAEFVRLHSLLPFLPSKPLSQLEIVLEAITYIHLLQARLQGAGQENRPGQ